MAEDKRKRVRGSGKTALSRERMKAGLTIVQFADLTGLSRPYLHYIESGNSLPSAESAHAIADALKVPVSTLFEIECIPKVIRVK